MYRLTLILAILSVFSAGAGDNFLAHSSAVVTASPLELNPGQQASFSAQPAPQAPGRRATPPAALSWVRTRDGWERGEYLWLRPGWLGSPTLDPRLVGLLQLLVSLFALLAFPCAKPVPQTVASPTVTERVLGDRMLRTDARPPRHQRRGWPHACPPGVFAEHQA